MFRMAIRQHLRHRAFAATVVGTLALAIGATIAVFSVVNAVILRALPFTAPDRLVWVASVRSDNPSAPFTLPEFMDYRTQTRSLSGLAAYANWSASLAGEGITERLQGTRISANAFDVLGISAAAGRLLNDSDDRPDAPRVVVISHRLWQRRFGGAADAIGAAARINSEPFTIVGVLPPRFPWPLPDIDVFTPLVPDTDPLRHVRRSVNFLRLFGRVRDGVDATEAAAELSAICRSLKEQFPVEYARKDAVAVTPLHGAIVGNHRQPMLVLQGAVVVVLSTALANLLSLALVRANDRRREMRIRIAIGASRANLMRQCAVEASVLAALGCGFGWVVATQLIAAVTQWAPASIPRMDEVRFDTAVVMLALAITAVVAVLLALVPLGATRNRWNQRVRGAMVVGEISAALVLSISTLVLIQNLRTLSDVEAGFHPDGVFQARLSLPPTYRTPDDVARFYERLSERIAASPGVDEIGVISVAPLSGLLSTIPFSVEGQAEERARPNANLRQITPRYLTAVGTRLVQGRPFAETDTSSTPPVALVSEALAARVLGGNAVGKRLLLNDNNQGPRPVEIVGVVENVRHSALDLPPAFDVYLPLRQTHPDHLGFVRTTQFWMIKTAADPEAFRNTFVSLLRGVDPDAAVARMGAMRAFVDEWLGPHRFTLGLFGAFALTAVLLAVSGLYGLVSYAVSQRTSEIALRVALGATQSSVQRFILGQAAALGVGGVIVGATLAIVVRPLLSGLVRDASVRPATVALTAAVLMVTVLLAAWLPARRASRIEPTLALRAQ